LKGHQGSTCSAAFELVGFREIVNRTEGDGRKGRNEGIQQRRTKSAGLHRLVHALIGRTQKERRRGTGCSKTPASNVLAWATLPRKKSCFFLRRDDAKGREGGVSSPSAHAERIEGETVGPLPNPKGRKRRRGEGLTVKERKGGGDQGSSGEGVLPFGRTAVVRCSVAFIPAQLQWRGRHENTLERDRPYTKNSLASLEGRSLNFEPQEEKRGKSKQGSTGCPAWDEFN